MAQYIYINNDLKITSEYAHNGKGVLDSIETVILWGDKIVKKSITDTVNLDENNAIKKDALDLAAFVEQTIFIKMYDTFVEREGWKKATQKRIEKTKNHLLTNNEFYKELTDFIKTETEK